MNKGAKIILIPILCFCVILAEVIAIDQVIRAYDEPESIHEVKDARKIAVQECKRGAGISREFIKMIKIAENEEKTAEKPKKKQKAAESQKIAEPKVEIEPQKSVEPPKAAVEETEKAKEIDPDDLYVLAHVIDGEGRGEDDVFKWLVGAVVLNRVKADIYPNTIKDVVYQVDKWGKQYACVWDGNYAREPEQSSWDIAELLLTEGITEDNIPKTVTYQSSDPNQGETWKEYKCKTGVTCYFCHNKWIK